MAEGIVISQVTGETPSMDRYLELKDILASFGMDAASFDSIPGPAQVFLVGQYAELRKSDKIRTKLERRVRKTEELVIGLQHNLEVLINRLKARGGNDDLIKQFLQGISGERRKHRHDSGEHEGGSDATHLNLKAV